MALFLTIGYGDEDGYRSTADSVLAAAHSHDRELTERGAVIGVAGAPFQVRNHDARGVEVEDGPFLRAGLPLAGFALLEAKDVQEAIELVSATPCAVARGVVEVWPIDVAPS